MADIIDFQQAKMRLRPRAVRTPTFLVLEIPEELAQKMEAADAVDVLAQFDFLIH